MLNVGVAERERPRVIDKKSGSPRRLVSRAERSEKIKADIVRRNEMYLQRRREAVVAAKQSGDKEPLDIERYFKAALRSSNEAEIQQLLKDPKEVERVEFQYYLLSPKEVTNFEKFMDWVLTQL